MNPILKPAGLASLAFSLVLVASASAFAHGGEDHSHDDPAPASSGKPVATAFGEAAAPQRLADGALFVPKVVQRQLALRTQLARVADLAATVELNGRVIADPNRGGRVQATQAGSILPGPKGLPRLGQKVRKGEVLAYLRPIASSIELGNQRAQLAELESQLALAESRVKRYQQLEGALPQKEIEAARVEWQALKKRHAAVAQSISAAEPLVAPAAGVISALQVVAGQVVEAREILFEIVDPAHLLVEALAYDPALVDAIVSASGALGAGALDLQFIGGGRQLREQALPLVFRVTTPNAPVAVGQPVKVIARTAHAGRGVALPQSALVKSVSGETVVWVHRQAERFVALKVRHQPLDATAVAVTEGLAGGDRVVVDGAGLLAQIR